MCFYWFVHILSYEYAFYSYAGFVHDCYGHFLISNCFSDFLFCALIERKTSRILVIYAEIKVLGQAERSQEPIF